MERLPGMHGRGGPMGLRRGEEWVVRSQKREPFEIEAQSVEGSIYVPLETPVYRDDIVERADPRGDGVIEYVVLEVVMNRDPFGRGRDYSEVKLRERGFAPRQFGTVNVTIAGGTNQVAIGNDSAWLSQTSSVQADGLVALLESIVANAPAELAVDEREELAEAVNEATALIQSPSPKANAVKRALRAVRGLAEDLGQSATAGASEAVKAWAKAIVASLAMYLTSNS